VEIKHLASDGGWEPSMAIVDDVLAELTGRGPARRDQWLISSFSWATIAAVRERDTTMATAFLTISATPAVIARTAAAGHQAIHPWQGAVDADLVDRAHAAGLRVNTWTCNDPDRLRALADLGVDGVCTDVPDVALAALGRT
jgi:glycerophosphoryl diester phosphodiesterase